MASAPLSPDGLFRSLVVEGTLWVSRVDGAWIWQVELPPPPASPGGSGTAATGTATGAAGLTPGASGTAMGVAGAASAGAEGAATGQSGSAEGAGAASGTAGTATAAPRAPIPVIGTLQWSPRSTLVFQDGLNRWLEANPATAIVTPLSPTFQGVTALILSPDGRQVLFYKGNQLFTALQDGSQARLIGENLTGHWDSTGQLITTKAGQPAAPTEPAL